MLETVRQDIRYAIRTLAREPGWTLAVICTLALAAGATTAVSVSWTRWSFGLWTIPTRIGWWRWNSSRRTKRAERPAAQSERDRDRFRMVTNYPNYERLRGATGDVLEGLAAYDDNWEYSVRLQGRTERLRGALVAADLFRLLRVRSHLGRGFEGADDQPGAAGTVILSL